MAAMERDAGVFTDWVSDEVETVVEQSEEDRTCRHLWSVLFVIVIVLAGAGAVGAIAYGRTDPPGANLTFISQGHNLKSKIVGFDMAHGFAFNLTRLDTGEDSESWSPDGRQLAFVSWRDLHRNLFVMDTATRQTEKISELRVAPHYRPMWSPDGRRLAFEVETGGDIDLAMADLDTGTLQMLAASPDLDRFPVWSPDGKRIAFVSWRSGNAEIYLADLSCGGSLCADPADITHSHGEDAFPIWSPDGKSILFLSDRDGYREVYVMDAECDGGSVSCNRRVRQLTRDHSKANNLIWDSPAWSPDGRSVAYLSDPDDTNVQINLIDMTARAKPGCCAPTRPLTHGAWDNANVVWSPDGREIAFTAHRSGNWDIFLLEPETGETRQLTTSPADDYSPMWMPASPSENLFADLSILR